MDKVEAAASKILGLSYVGEKYVKRKFRFLFVQEGSAWTREDMVSEIFYSACIYYILKARRHPREEKPTLNYLKVKIARLHSKQFQSIIIDKHECTLFHGEIPSLSHLLQLRKQIVSRIIRFVIPVVLNKLIRLELIF